MRYRVPHRRAATQSGLTQVLERMKAITTLIAMIVAGPVLASDCNLPCKMNKALKGDGQAALDMAQASLYQDHEIMVNWYRIAAENGNPLGQWNYATWLIADSKSRQDCIRASYWLDRAYAGGQKDAREASRQIKLVLSDPKNFQNGCPGAL